MLEPLHLALLGLAAAVAVGGGAPAVGSARAHLASVAPGAVAADPLSDVSVGALRVEYAENPLGIDVRAPRFGWRLDAPRRGVSQQAYQIHVAATEEDLRRGRALLWDSTRVMSDASAHVVYAGPALQAGRRYVWQVRVWDDAGRVSGWSAPASWEMGLLAPSDWTASWIEPGLPEDPKVSGPSPLLRREFVVRGPVQRARAYVTAHGLYDLQINGRRVGDQFFTPGWTSYHHRLQYQTYDVTALLQKGPNAIGVMLGNGWYRGRLAWEGNRNIYGQTLAVLVQVRVTYADGGEETIGTDRTWKASTGPVLMSEIYDGETYDARLEKAGWTSPGFDDRGWTPAVTAAHRKDHLVAPAGPPVRAIEEVRPVKVFRTPGGDTVADLGQNMVGWVRLRVQGPAGTTVTLRHAEVLDTQGNLYTANLRGAKATARYTLKGGAPEVYEPRFTFFGFRYVAVDGYPGEVTPDALTGIVVHSAMRVTGAFSTSHAAINQLQRNIVWGQKGNFLDVPTDCPQRDERLGWTGDAQVFARTAAFNMDVAGFFAKWLADLAADQYPDGRVPHVIPNVLQSRPDSRPGGSAAWGDAAVIVPWTMYLTYGDVRVLERQFPSMVKWVAFQASRAGDDLVWDGDPHFGDWLAFSSTDSSYPGATTGKDLIATAFLAHSADLVARAADVLGRSDEAARHRALFERVRRAFQREFVTETGRVGENTQTAYVLALHFDLLPKALQPEAARRLAADVRTRGHLTTGFVGTPYLCHVLTRFGYLDEAYTLLKRDRYPSWLYPVTRGATTIWERWDGQRPDGSFQDAGMNSFNHYAYGAIGDWMYSVLAGLDLDPKAPGYRHVLVAPRPGGGFTKADAAFESLYGRVRSAWSIAQGTFTLEVEVPPNTRATVRIPAATIAQVMEGQRPLAVGSGITTVRQDDTAVVIEVGSGHYRFTSPAR